MRRVLLVLALAAGAAAQEEETPKQLGIVERAGRNLVQIDVTVTGDPEVIATLAKNDFQLAVGGRSIEEFVVDRVCAEPVAAAPEEVATSTGESSQPPIPGAAARANYLFYFGQAHLRMGGRVRALEMAPQLIDGLVTEGARGMIVSSGRDLRVIVGLTDDVVALKRGVKEIEKDPTHWVPYASLEELRIEETLNAPSQNLALAIARRHQQEEQKVARRELKRFEMAIARLSELDSPKILVYFADTMRKEPGRHYLYRLGASPADSMLAASIDMSAFAGALTYDKAIDVAAAHGVRLYTVHAEGLLARFDNHQPTTPYKDAQNAMAGLALETGGRAFLNGIPPKKMIRQIREDLNCVYLISFDARKLPQDKGLPMTVRVTRPRVRVRARGRVVVQSEQARVAARLLTSFVSPEMASPDFTLSGAVVPTRFDNGKFGALVQIAIDAQPFTNAEWNLGASLVSRGTVQAELSGQVRVDRPGAPIVLEGEMRFPPGEYEIVAVARETGTNQVGTVTFSGDWPKPGADAVTLGPIAVLQSVDGIFVLGDELRNRGLLGADEDAPVDPARPVRLVGLVCRKRSMKSPLRLERALKGSEDAPFPVNRIDFGKDRCVRVEDEIPAGSMAPGVFTYEVRAMVGDEQVALRERELLVQ